MAPEDMDLVGRAMPASTAGLDPFERRGAIEAGLKKLHISGDVIAVLMKRLASERTILHEWDFDYIRKRFEIYRGEMARDKDWQKIDAAFRRSLAGNGVREGLESLKGYHCNYDESKK